MDEPNPFGDFESMPFFGEIMRMLGQQGGGWDAAKQLAMAAATEGATEPNVDPLARMEFEQLGRVAELQLTDRTGLTAPGGTVGVEAVTRSHWAATSLDALKPLFTELNTSLGATPADLDETEDPGAAMFAGLMKALGPMMLSVTAGTMVGRLATRSLGMYDLPIPRDTTTVLLIEPNVSGFGSDWSLDDNDLRLWVCLHDIAHHMVLGVPHVGGRITSLLTQHASGFEADASALEERLGDIDLSGDPMALASLGQSIDPEMLLGAVQSPQQRELLPHLEALVSVVIGFVDHTMDQIGSNLIGSYPMITEALRRRRVETDEADRFVERILGLNLTQEQVDRGSAFVQGVVDREGDDGLGRLWSDERHLPTPSEVDAPGLWLARIDLPED